jgi:penicillin-binding protein 1C
MKLLSSFWSILRTVPEKTGNKTLGRKWALAILVWIGLALALFFTLPRVLFNDPCTTLLLDRDGTLLEAKIASDHQWRFPESEEIPEKFRQSVIHFEDRWFNFHPGFNPVALFRAAVMNFRAGKIVSGGSTLSMQVIRLARKNRPRTIGEKIIEIFLSWRLELTHTKQDILRLYASHAPFGGNVVGLEAASWRYFGVEPDRLSWGATATLAVLPNAPGLIFPGKNQKQLLAKRNRLLDRLFEHGVITASECEMAKSEPLPGKPFSLPRSAPHLLDHAIADGLRGKRLCTSLLSGLQRQTAAILEGHRSYWNANEIRNAALVVLEVSTGNVVAYHGNIPNMDSRAHGEEVDLVMAPRSTGSILKPFLYAAMLNDGLILPGTLIPDIPTQIGGFVPENFNLSYDGAVPANQALARSLNIPAVKMLQTYTYQQFYILLKRCGITTLTKPAGHYGLSVILGGAETNLWEITGTYASMARTLQTAGSARPVYATFHAPGYVDKPETRLNHYPSPFNPAAIYQAFEAMVEVVRPGEEMVWRQFGTSSRIAWKTGTSFGNRDAWAVGVTPQYVVGVWVGNASGEGRPGLTGIAMAAPVLFDVFRILPVGSWFTAPESSMIRVPVCRYSGYRASPVCEFSDSVWIPAAGAKTLPCPFHQIVHLDSTGQWQVTSECELPSRMQHRSWFVLPPVQEWYFRQKNPFYRILPPFKPGCGVQSDRRNMDLIYPKNKSILFIPVELDGTPGRAVFRAAHREPGATIYWHLDDQYIGSTKTVHQMAVKPVNGRHQLTLTDQNGESISVVFEIISRQ